MNKGTLIERIDEAISAVWAEYQTAKGIDGVDTDRNGSQITVYPYRYNGDGWAVCDGISLAALRAGLSRGSIEFR